MTTNIDITNRALAQIGSRSQITSMTDGSAEALYANLLYVPLRDFLLREGDYDFSIVPGVPLAVSATAALPPWVYAYTCPTALIHVRSLLPTVYDPLSPLPVEYNVTVAGSGRIIQTKQSASFVIYTFAPAEDFWDAIFTEAFTRLLSSALAFALQNRIEASRAKLTEALNFAGIANLRDS